MSPEDITKLEEEERRIGADIEKSAPFEGVAASEDRGAAEGETSKGVAHNQPNLTIAIFSPKLNTFRLG
jgi:hypothetical protein